jgi:type 1 glutamine amidotransferase
LAVDETTYNPKVSWPNKKGEGMGKMHPIAWYHNYDGGQSFYTALGHLSTNFSNEAFLIICMLVSCGLQPEENERSQIV